MAASVDKAEKKMDDDVEEVAMTSKSEKEIEPKLNPHDVSYKIKDETK